MELMLAQWVQGSQYRFGECADLPQLPDGTVVNSRWMVATSILVGGHAEPDSALEPGPQTSVSAGGATHRPVPSQLLDWENVLQQVTESFWEIDLGLPGVKGARMHSDTTISARWKYASCAEGGPGHRGVSGRKSRKYD